MTTNITNSISPIQALADLRNCSVKDCSPEWIWRDFYNSPEKPLPRKEAFRIARELQYYL